MSLKHIGLPCHPYHTSVCVRNKSEDDTGDVHLRFQKLMNVYDSLPAVFLCSSVWMDDLTKEESESV